MIRPFWRNIKRDEERLLKLGWTTDGFWWYNPRSGIRYNRATAIDIEDLRSTPIKI